VAREFKELKRIETEPAKERMSAGGKGVAILPHLLGKSRDKAAAMVGMGARTAEKFEKIVDDSQPPRQPRSPSGADFCNLAYSALACFRMGMSGSASFQSVRKSL
jgi:hypothetical protein